MNSRLIIQNLWDNKIHNPYTVLHTLIAPKRQKRMQHFFMHDSAQWLTRLALLKALENKKDNDLSQVIDIINASPPQPTLLTSKLKNQLLAFLYYYPEYKHRLQPSAFLYEEATKLTDFIQEDIYNACVKIVDESHESWSKYTLVKYIKTLSEIRISLLFKKLDELAQKELAEKKVISLRLYLSAISLCARLSDKEIILFNETFQNHFVTFDSMEDGDVSFIVNLEIAKSYKNRVAEYSVDQKKFSERTRLDAIDFCSDNVRTQLKTKVMQNFASDEKPADLSVEMFERATRFADEIPQDICQNIISAIVVELKVKYFPFTYLMDCQSAMLSACAKFASQVSLSTLWNLLNKFVSASSMPLIHLRDIEVFFDSLKAQSNACKNEFIDRLYLPENLEQFKFVLTYYKLFLPCLDQNLLNKMLDKTKELLEEGKSQLPANYLQDIIKVLKANLEGEQASLVNEVAQRHDNNEIVLKRDEADSPLALEIQILKSLSGEMRKPKLALISDQFVASFKSDHNYQKTGNLLIFLLKDLNFSEQKEIMAKLIEASNENTSDDYFRYHCAFNLPSLRQLPKNIHEPLISFIVYQTMKITNPNAETFSYAYRCLCPQGDSDENNLKQERLALLTHTLDHSRETSGFYEQILKPIISHLSITERAHICRELYLKLRGDAPLMLVANYYDLNNKQALKVCVWKYRVPENY